MTDPYRLRRGVPGDSRAAFDVFLPAIRDLTTRHGSPWKPDPEKLRAEPLPMLERLASRFDRFIGFSPPFFL